MVINPPLQEIDDMKLNSNNFGKIILFSVLVLFFKYSPFSQSDTPCGSTPLALGAECTFITHDASLDTYGSEGGIPSCGHYANTLAEEDTWYSFVAPAAGSVNLESSTVVGSTFLQKKASNHFMNLFDILIIDMSSCANINSQN
jgi:hypothetical protein